MKYNTRNTAITAITAEINRTIDFLKRYEYTDDYHELYLYQLNDAYKDLMGCDHESFKGYKEEKQFFGLHAK